MARTYNRANLPVWARDELLRLERQLELAERRLGQIGTSHEEPEGKVFARMLGPGGKHIYLDLPEDAEVVFRVERTFGPRAGHPSAVRVRLPHQHEDLRPCLKLMADGCIMAQQQASNTAKIYTGRIE